MSAIKAKIQKWGNSLGVRFPKSVASLVDLQLDDEVELQPHENAIWIVKADQPETLNDLIAKSDPKAFALTNEDREWFGGAVGREIID